MCCKSDLDVLVKGLQPVQTKSEEHLEGIHTQCNYLGDSFRETMRMYRSGPVPWGQVFEALRGVGEERLCSELKVKYGEISTTESSVICIAAECSINTVDISGPILLLAYYYDSMGICFSW